MSTTLKQCVLKEFFYYDEQWTDIIQSTLTEDQLNKDISENSRLPNFTVWTDKRVYFPVNIKYHAPGDYAMNKWEIESVPRNPCDEEVDMSFAV